MYYFAGVVASLQRHKLLFIETQDSAETSFALINYIKVKIVLDKIYRLYKVVLISVLSPNYLLTKFAILILSKTHTYA